MCPDTSDLVTSNVTAVTSNMTSSVTTVTSNVSSVINLTAVEELSSVHSNQTLPELGHPFTIVSAIHLVSGIVFLCVGEKIYITIVHSTKYLNIYSPPVAGGVKMPV